YSSTSMSTLGFIDINKAPFKVFIFSMSTLKGAFQGDSLESLFFIVSKAEKVIVVKLTCNILR
ncbi:hypothetical protein, partial [Staphylococcus aureus]|uniref:hypothetical protein n=1 Tax=Staphylococcus aureus TaxID=1280 RepID=UPI001EDDEA06